MHKHSRVRLTAALVPVLVLGFVTSGTTNAASSEELTEKSSLIAVDPADSNRVQLNSRVRNAKKNKKEQTKVFISPNSITNSKTKPIDLRRNHRRSICFAIGDGVKPEWVID